MRIIKKIWFLLFIVFVSGCSGLPKPEQPVVCGVTYGFIVNPSGELTNFKLFLPPTCNEDGLHPEVSDAWAKTACAYFSASSPRPTYEIGESVRMLYGNYFYRPDRLNTLYPTVNAGRSIVDPFVHVQESILESRSEQKHVCDEDLVVDREATFTSFIGHWVEEWPLRSGKDVFTVTSDERGVRVTSVNNGGSYRYRVDSEKIEGDILSFRLVVVESGYVLNYRVEPINNHLLRATITGTFSKTLLWERRYY